MIQSLDEARANGGQGINVGGAAGDALERIIVCKPVKNAFE